MKIYADHRWARTLVLGLWVLAVAAPLCAADSGGETSYRTKRLRYQAPDPYRSKARLEYENPDMQRERYRRMVDVRNIMSGIVEGQELRPIVIIPAANEDLAWLKESMEDLRKLKVNNYIEFYEEIKGKQTMTSVDVRELEDFTKGLMSDLVKLKDLEARLAVEKAAKTIIPKVSDEKAPEVLPAQVAGAAATKVQAP